MIRKDFIEVWDNLKMEGKWELMGLSMSLLKNIKGLCSTFYDANEQYIINLETRIGELENEKTLRESKESLEQDECNRL